ncbi:TldD/PmbA family protein [Anaerobranca gottschalkii]|uniref:PmbA protein n=1 Tax=Anaerobranca gottschalkii DSM 13577 TaxID=1120990 RepID=A0A1I0CPB7_9FIRM|nr:TldD/PmbA family protein [Anaerobranca gottschalkii]SET21109.1 PmbA protein [Anaerobranca gottschalkii DSM 13577]
MNIQNFKDKLFAKGKEHGFTDMEIYFTRSNNFSVKIFKGEVDDYSVADESGLAFRGLYKGKMGYSFTEKVDESSIDILVEEAKGNAMIIEDEDEVEIFSGSPQYSDYDGYNPELENFTAEMKIQFAKKLEEAAFAQDKRVVAVNYCLMASGEGEKIISNTKGLEKRAKDNLAYTYLSVVVKDGENIKTGAKFLGSTQIEDFNAEEIAKKAVNEALAMLGAETVKSKTYPVIFRNDMANSLLATFSSIFSAENVQKDLSLLKGKIGEIIANEKVTLIDDPLMKNGLASTPFDAEGVATYTKEIISQGRLNTFLHNLKTAKKDRVKSTGNGYKASFKGAVGIAPTNMYIKPGNKTFEELVATIDEGLVITEVQGLHSGTNTVSGDFSLAAQGFLIEKGKIVRPVDQITIAGNFYEVLQDIEEVGNDLEFGLPSRGYFGSPSLKIKKIAVSGK